jgi:DNA-binding winged helix-turn-helix (wHTH) protein
MRVRLGDVVFDADARAVLRGGTVVPLSPKAFRLLELLIARRPRAVSKSEISEVLWPSTFVSEGNVTVLMAEIRRAIGDGEGRRVIRTLHGFGYALDAPAVDGAPAPPGAFAVFYEKRALMLRSGANVLGRGPDCDVKIDHPSVSRHHARIVVGADDAALEDLDSKNGTFLAGRRVEKGAPLADGAVIGLGSAVLTFTRLAMPSTMTGGPAGPDGGAG